MKKLRITLLLTGLCCAFTLSAQGDKEIIDQEIIGHIYKPIKKKPSASFTDSLKLPEGFKIDVYADNLGKPRMMAKNSNGDVYVTRRSGDIIRLVDDNKDGKADSRDTALVKDAIHGIDIKGDTAYLVTVNEVFKSKISDNGSMGELEQIAEDLPDGGQHENRTLAMGPDGQLYVSVGSTCNACDETRDENATIVRMDPKTGERSIFAKGLRNTIGFDWQPETDVLFGMDHGIDWLGDNEQKEELNKIEEGNNYGWPYIYADGKFNKADKPKDMSWEEYVKKTTQPVQLFTAHSAPLDFIFYRGNMFPEEYRKKALVTFRGSWNRRPAAGYKLITVDFEGETAAGESDLVTGFLSEDGKSQYGRLVGLLELEDGSVLMSDDENGIIYRISYGEN
ncbi:MAG: PQQ-dependent sugar dehydrogenase [Pricia sp.]